MEQLSWMHELVFAVDQGCFSSPSGFESTVWLLVVVRLSPLCVPANCLDFAGEDLN